MRYYKDICSEIFSEHEKSVSYKSSLGKKGLFEQINQNRRFFSGDQWHGAKVGNDKPLVRHNIIKRIGEYKTAVIGGDEVNIAFSPIGIGNNLNEENSESVKFSGKVTNEEIITVSKAVSNYLKNYFKKIHFDDICNSALKNAYISGCGAIYTYWDCNEKTGLYIDDKRTLGIKGDIKSEVIGIENIDFHDPSNTNINSQEYIIVSSRRTVASLRREAKENGISKEQIENIKPDNEYSREALYSQKATVLTKFYKSYDKNGDYTIKAIKVCKSAVIKPEWNTELKRYPIALFPWEQTGNIYAESEITNLIPNQIAINRMMTASTWAVMMTGMPIMMVNADIITEPITNNPGQIISFYGDSDNFEKAVKYITPPTVSSDFESLTSKLIENTLNSVGATDAALGTIDAHNTSAIESIKQSAKLPLTIFKKRYLSFIEDIAQIYLEFMMNMYSNRPLIQKENGKTDYFDFDSKRYKDYSFYCEAEVISDNQNRLNALLREIDSLDKYDKKEFEKQIKNNTKENDDDGSGNI